MPKCLECGVEAQRLQWTHFKYKCTGKFKNGKEYQAAYPGSKVVDEELSQKLKLCEQTKE
jgi:beta-mannanase